MLNIKSPIKNIIFLIVFLIIVFAIIRLNGMAKVGVGYITKVACSEVYIAQRPLNEVMELDFNDIDPLMKYVKVKNNQAEQTVQANLFGLGRAKALYRDGLGCTLDMGQGLADVKRSTTLSFDTHNYQSEINQNLQAILDGLFSNTDSSLPFTTRSAIVIQNGKIVAENYASGFNQNTPQQSWSMAKGVTQALIGIAVKKQLLELSDQSLLPQWSGDDPRANINLGHLLHMASGLEFSEDYADPFSHVDQMLFNQHDMGMYAAQQALVQLPGTSSIYSSGTSNIVSQILENKLLDNKLNHIDFVYQELFNKLGMRSAIFEIDASGSFIGSSYIYATLRDYARFGQLYLQEGVWEKQQILPLGWVEYTRQPAKHSDDKYGSHWSVNAKQKNFPGLPDDVIALGGNDGQHIFVIPSKNAVIVRLGLMRMPATFEKDLYPHIQNIYDNL